MRHVLCHSFKGLLPLALMVMAASWIPAGPVHAQAVGTVGGQVLDAQTERPLAGAQVFIAGGQIGTLTNTEGRYLLQNVPVGGVTVSATLIGYRTVQRTVTVVAGEVATLNFSLGQTAIALDEIVVTGAGQATERRKLGNSIATVDISAIEHAPVTSFSELLQGREPGVMGLTAGGMAGTGQRIKIRGSASLSQSNSPIIYLDGVRIDNAGGHAPGVGSGGGDGSPSRLDDINPDAIARIEVLKGAAAATLFGTQASNGVIQIFTKRGNISAPRFRASIEQGFTSFPNRFAQHAGFVVAETPSDRVQGRDVGAVGVRERWGIDVDPYEVFEVDMIGDLFETGSHQTYTFSVDGGTPLVTYFLSARRHAEDGPFDAAQFAAAGFDPAHDQVGKTQANANLTVFPRDALQIRIATMYTEGDNRAPSGNNNIFGVLSSMINSRPELAHEDNLYGSPAFATTRENAHRLTMSDVKRFVGSVSANYQALPSLNLDFTFGLDAVNQRGANVIPFGWNVDGFTGSNIGGDRFVSDRNHREVTLDGKGVWNATFGRDFTSSLVLGGQGFLTRTEAAGGSGNQFPGPGLDVAGAGALQTVFETFSEEVNAGVYLQEQVGFRDWVFVTAGARMDQHSAFGETTGGALYPKLSVSVVPSDRPGWTMGTLRLRGAWGRSGLQPGAFDKFTTFEPLAAATGPGLVPGNLGNENLKPEVSTEIELGGEVGFLDDRVSLDVTYWTRDVQDLLVDKQFAPSGGFTNRQLANVGDMTASGLEIAARAVALSRGDVSLDLFASAGKLSEEVVSLGGAPPLKVGGSYPRYRQFTREGFAPGAFFGPVLQDVALPIDLGRTCTASSEADLLAYFAQPRSPDVIFPLVEDCGTADELNHFLGKPTPDWQGSFGANLSFLENFQVSTMFEARWGNYFAHDLSGSFRDAHPLIGRNTREAAEVEAILINPASTPQERLDAAVEWVSELRALSPWDGLNEIHPADFIRLRELSLTYSVPASLAARAMASSLDITVSGRNLALWTKFPGVDPEISQTAATNAGGVDANFQEGVNSWGVPIPRRISITVRAGF